VTATGWGKLSDDAFTKSDRLNFAKDLPVLTNAACNDYYGIITEGHICIDSTGGHGVCSVSTFTSLGACNITTFYDCN
jgi:hypothetical protein